MVVLKIFLQICTGVILALFVAIILYFPVIELVTHFALTTRLIRMPPAFPINDALLPLLCLAIVYSAIAKLMRKVCKPELAGRAPHLGKQSKNSLSGEQENR